MDFRSNRMCLRRPANSALPGAQQGVPILQGLVIVALSAETLAEPQDKPRFVQASDLEAFYETLAMSTFRDSSVTLNLIPALRCACGPAFTVRRPPGVSVTLANPAMPDCPLAQPSRSVLKLGDGVGTMGNSEVGVSQGFQRMTGWTRSEIIGSCILHWLAFGSIMLSCW